MDDLSTDEESGFDDDDDFRLLLLPSPLRCFDDDDEDLLDVRCGSLPDRCLLLLLLLESRLPPEDDFFDGVPLAEEEIFLRLLLLLPVISLFCLCSDFSLVSALALIVLIGVNNRGVVVTSFGVVSGIT